ncbi:hypothetical protein ACFS5L_20700 [Streptomyces phyllanthi]|uniref:Sigma-like protein n=1 Tax=Streptomyces phyllanthi TaxID=1803180 RepID=A0A5N8WFU7_9ACTN|nr:hypothetical protein [Streptomyces phyllanthi]MPY46353.1 hypothetical protein [Streptomyces phyllanthi]
MSDNEKDQDVTSQDQPTTDETVSALENAMPTPPAPGPDSIRTMENAMPSEPADIRTMENAMPAPPALDLDGK